jgi:hypothetical protein
MAERVAAGRSLERPRLAALTELRGCPLRPRLCRLPFLNFVSPSPSERLLTGAEAGDGFRKLRPPDRLAAHITGTLHLPWDVALVGAESPTLGMVRSDVLERLTTPLTVRFGVGQTAFARFRAGVRSPLGLVALTDERPADGAGHNRPGAAAPPFCPVSPFESSASHGLSPCVSPVNVDT